MAGNPIEQYQIAFEKLSLAQKKVFIDRLRNQIYGRNLPAYAKLLAECVQKYNAEAHPASGNTHSSNSSVGKNADIIGNANTDMQASFTGEQLENRNPTTIIITAIIIILIAIFVNYAMSDLASNSNIVGEWQGDTRGYVFDRNGEYTFLQGHTGIEFYDGKFIAGTPTIDKEYGRYKISGNTITLEPEYKEKRSYTFTIKNDNTLILDDNGRTSTFIRI
jgi:hypothetical protein